MVYFLGIMISLTAGFLVIRLLTAGRLNLILHLLFALLLGFGIDGAAAFYSHILFNQFNRWIPVGLVLLGIVILFSVKYYPVPKFQMTRDLGWGLLALGVLAVPLTVSAYHFPLGGWDAWSCWNLKAKFIFLGQEKWKDVLSPGLWRSNTNYPLLWPLMNVWFWDLGDRFDQVVPMFNSIIFALLTAGILLFGLLELTGKLWASVSAAVLITALPYGVTQYTSQYSDILLGLFLLSAFMSWLLAEKKGLPQLKILAMLFLGMMSFTKNEGLIAAGIAALGILWHERAHKKELPSMIQAFLITALPTVIFTLFMAPKNEAFVNGLLSSEKPVQWMRLIVLMIYPWFELLTGKWHCFWLLALGGGLLAGMKLWKSALGVIGCTLALYLGVVMAYYAVNTFFEINWWLSTTLSRILLALIPTLVLWVAAALLNPEEL